MRKRQILSFMLVCALMWFAAVHAAAVTKYSDGVYTFEKTETDTAVITDCSLTDSDIAIPDTVLGYTVTGIGDYAFMSFSDLRSVSLPDSLCSIGEYGFANNASLESVTIPRNCEEIADNAFWRSPSVTIYCYAESYAQQYAEEHNIAYHLFTDISGAQVEIEADAFRYDGTAHEPAVTVSLDGVVLNPGTDYSVNYTDNQSVGTATVTVSGIGDYAGQAYANFAICNVLGDVDGNGLVEVVDATMIQRYLSEMEIPFADRVELVGDVDGDGVSVIDATFIRRYLVMMDVPYPIDSLMD